MLKEKSGKEKGLKLVRIYIPNNTTKIIDFGFRVINAMAFFPEVDEKEDDILHIIQNGRLTRKAIKFYGGRAYYSAGKFRIHNFQKRDTTILLFEAPDGAFRKYVIEEAPKNGLTT